jgi:hypothetical protein
MPVIPMLGQQNSHEFEANLGYIEIPCLETKKKSFWSGEVAQAYNPSYFT